MSFSTGLRSQLDITEEPRCPVRSPALCLSVWHATPLRVSSGPAPPGCHDNESAPRAQLLLGRDPGWTAGPGLGATAATAAATSSPPRPCPASRLPAALEPEAGVPSPPHHPARMPKVKALQCALALEIRSVSIGPVPPQPSGPSVPTLDTPGNVECPPTPASRGPHPNFLLECFRISSTPLQSCALRTVFSLISSLLLFW